LEEVEWRASTEQWFKEPLTRTSCSPSNLPPLVSRFRFPLLLQRGEPENSTHTLPPMNCLQTVSGPFDRAPRAAFHLSLTVLVRYRSLVRIQLWMEFTTRLVLQSQTTRLSEHVGVRFRSRGQDGAITLPGAAFQRTWPPNSSGSRRVHRLQPSGL
jgi:hypothetical protein